MQSSLAIVPSSMFISSSIQCTILLSFIIFYQFLPHFGWSIIKLHLVFKQWPIFMNISCSIRIILPYRKIENHLISMISPILWKNSSFINCSIAHLHFHSLLLGSEAITNYLPILFPLFMHLQTFPWSCHCRNPLLKVLMPVHLWLEVRSSQKQIIILLVHAYQPTATGLDIFEFSQRSFPSLHGRLSSDNIIQRFNVSFGLIQQSQTLAVSSQISSKMCISQKRRVVCHCGWGGVKVSQQIFDITGSLLRKCYKREWQSSLLNQARFRGPFYLKWLRLEAKSRFTIAFLTYFTQFMKSYQYSLRQAADFIFRRISQLWISLFFY